MNKRRALALLAFLCLPLPALAAGGMALLPANPDLHDKASLQRGAKLFVNYCLSCHSMGFMRYNRMAEDLGIGIDLVERNLLFAGDKAVDEMTVAMPPDRAKTWFGVPPPDLSLVARSRGPDWLYSYLVTFYADDNPARPFGVNNLVFPDVAMPHVLWPLQGVARYEAADVPDEVEEIHPEGLRAAGEAIELHKVGVTADGERVGIVDRLVPDGTGALGPGQFRKAARDLTNFLYYAAEPAKLHRYRIGFWVVLFLVVLFFLSRALYHEYWRDVH